MQFPTLQGNTVSGKSRTLPRDFTGLYNIVLVAFTQAHQDDVNSWLPALESLQVNLPELAIYEVPVVPRMNFFQRKMLDYWMYNGIPDPATRDATITLYTDVAAFVQALNLPNTRYIAVLLVDSAGIVHWRTYGRINDEKLASLSLTLTQLQEPSA